MMILSPHRPLHIAARSGLARVVQELVQRGADLNARDCDGQPSHTHYPNSHSSLLTHITTSPTAIIMLCYLAM